MTFNEWLSLLAISLLGAFSPGPSLAVVVKNTLGGDRFRGIITAWSHSIGIGFYALLSLLGLAFALEKFPAVYKFIAYAGAIYLLWIGVKSLTSKGGISATLQAGKKLSYLECARDGLMISILNPKIGLFFIALFSQFIHPEVGTSGKVLTVLTPLITDGLWYSIVASTLSQPNILLFLRKKSHWIDRLSGALLIFLAVQIFWRNI